jgi:hypothetical protein
MFRSISRVLAAVGFVALAAVPALAQNTITLEGSVKSAGAPIAGAQVTVTNIATQETAKTVTRATGDFRVLGLFTGQYTVTVRAIGYKPGAETVQLVIGQRARLEFSLEKGVAELAAAQISGERVKQVEVQRLSVSSPVLKEEIENLPLNSRGIMNLASIAPGIKSYAPQSGRALPTSGGAPDLRFFNVYMDGVEMKSLYNGNIVGLGQTGSPLPQEALEQFRVFVNPYDAEYSRAGSYVISAESRRGTNKWEGSAFGFYQNKSLITQNAFQTAVPNFGRQQFGLNLRGPLIKDKLFFAGSYELASTDFYLDVNPTSGPWTSFKGSFLAPNKNHTLFTRLTWVQSPKITYDAMVSARFLKGEGNFGAKVAQTGGISQDYKIYTGQLRQRYLADGGNFVNEASLQLVSWNHNEAPLKPGPQLTYPGITFGTSGFPLILQELHLRAVDRATWNIDNMMGSHVIKAGVELSNISAKQNFANNANGSFNFLTDTSTLPNTASIAVGTTDPNGTSDAIASATGVTTGVYINDEWRPIENLTLSIGVRHDAEFNTMNNKYTVPWASDTTLQRLAASGGPLAGYLNRGDRQNQLGNFGPRFSFSWDPTKANKTFIRGGMGIIYDRVTSFIGFQERKNSTWRTYNFTFNNTTNLPTTDPAVLRARVAGGQAGSPAPILIKHDLKTPKNLQMSIGIGHQFTSEFGLNLDYVQQHLTNLYVQRNPNYLDKSVTPNARKLTSRFGDIVLWDDVGEANYSAILVSGTWQRNKTRINVAYTLGWYEGNFDTAALPNFALPMLFNMQRTMGDERHRLVISEVSPIPFGFTLSTIATIASPRPYTSIDGRDVNLDNITGDDYTGGTTTTSGIRTVRPSDKWDNWYRTVDLRLARPIFTVDGKKVSMSAEVFNLFNWSSNLSYGSTQFTAAGAAVASYGVPTGAYAARQMQVGMRIDW